MADESFWCPTRVEPSLSGCTLHVLLRSVEHQMDQVADLKSVVVQHIADSTMKEHHNPIRYLENIFKSMADQNNCLSMLLEASYRVQHVLDFAHGDSCCWLVHQDYIPVK